MDTSEAYIKMSDKSGLKENYSYIMPGITEKVKYVGNNVYTELDASMSTWRTVRLLRQGQIQKMLLSEFDEFSHIHCTFCNWALGMAEEFPSGEQLWLSFYMLKKHSKKWNGDKWVEISLINGEQKCVL